MSTAKQVSAAKAATTAKKSAAVAADSQAPKLNDAPEGAGSGQVIDNNAPEGANAGQLIDNNAPEGADAGQVIDTAGKEANHISQDAHEESSEAAAEADALAADDEKLFRVVVRNHSGHAVNAAPGLTFLPCTSTPIPALVAHGHLLALRESLQELEKENYLRAGSLSADATEVKETNQ